MREVNKISVAICSYNGQQYIREQLESILRQTRVPDEIILVDDGSTDLTIETAKEVLSGSNISYEVLVNEKNLGVSANFAKAISHCTGDIIFTADQDDVWIENKVERIIRVFQEKEDTALVFTNAELVSKDLESLGVDLWTSYFFDLCQFNDHDADHLLKKNYITGATMAFRAFDCDNVFPVPEGLYHDQWIGLNALRFGKVVALEEKLILYRQHGNNVIGATKTSLLKRGKIFKENIRKSPELKRKSLYWLHNLADRSANDSSPLKDKIASYIQFFEGSIRACSGKRISGIKWVRKHQADYTTYWIGRAGVIRDFLYILSRKKSGK